MRFREDKPADLKRARTAVKQRREQNPAGTEDQLTATLGSQFPPGYGPVLRGPVRARPGRHRPQNLTPAGGSVTTSASPPSAHGWPPTP